MNIIIKNALRGDKKMKSIFRMFSFLLILCLISISIMSCESSPSSSTNDSRSNESVDKNTQTDIKLIEDGFTVSAGATEETVYTALYCAYKFSKSEFSKDENIPFVLYFGADVEKRTIDKESTSPILIYIDKVDSDDVVILKELTVGELFVDKYDIDINYDEEHYISRINYSHSENFEIPAYLLTGNSGALRIKMSHSDEDDIQKNDGLGYGFDYHVVYYKVEQNTVTISCSNQIDY